MDRKELYTMAIDQEVRSQNLYEILAKSFRNSQTSSFFRELLLLEKTHEEKLRQACAREFPGLEIQVEGRLKQDLKGLDVSDPKALLNFAISREETARDHYKDFAAQTQDPGLKEMLLGLADEEEEHKSLLLTEIQRMQGALTWFDPSELNGLMEH